MKKVVLNLELYPVVAIILILYTCSSVLCIYTYVYIYMCVFNVYYLLCLRMFVCLLNIHVVTVYFYI